MYELPPILFGTEAQQIAALRDYLVRIARQENEGGGSASVSVGEGLVPSRQTTANDGQRAAPADAASVARLRALIVKNADSLRALSDRVEGIDGSYFYLRYSPVESPTAAQMTVAPNDDTAYLGVCSTSQESAPTDPTAYVWSRILGADALTLQIVSSQGSIFKNGAVETTLRAVVYLGDEDVTERFDEGDFRWTRISADAEADALWNSAHFGGTKAVPLTGDDVSGRATFFCELQ